MKVFLSGLEASGEVADIIKIFLSSLETNPKDIPKFKMKYNKISPFI